MECGKSVDTELCKQSVGKCRQIVVQKSIGAREYPSGRGEYTSAIWEVNMLGSVSGDWQGTIVRVS